MLIKAIALSLIVFTPYSNVNCEQLTLIEAQMAKSQFNVSRDVERKTISKELNVSLYEGDAFEDWFNEYHHAYEQANKKELDETREISKKSKKFRSRAVPMERCVIAFDFEFVKGKDDTKWMLDTVKTRTVTNGTLLTMAVSEHELKKDDYAGRFEVDIEILNGHLGQKIHKVYKEKLPLHFSCEFYYGEPKSFTQQVKPVTSGRVYNRTYPWLYEIDKQKYSLVPLISEFEMEVRMMYKELGYPVYEGEEGK